MNNDIIAVIIMMGIGVFLMILISELPLILHHENPICAGDNDCHEYCSLSYCKDANWLPGLNWSGKYIPLCKNILFFGNYCNCKCESQEVWYE